MDFNRIGLIAGQGNYPSIFAQSAAKMNIETVAFAIKGLAEEALEDHATEVIWIELGDLTKLVEITHQKNIKYLTMAGKVPPELIFSYKNFDEQSKLLINGMDCKQPEPLLKAMADFLSKANIEVISVEGIMREFFVEKGFITPDRPLTASEKKDVKFGYEIARGAAELNIGQTIVVKNGLILAVEAIEGTDEAIKRGAKLGPEGIVVIKTAKPKVDMRFDPPVIGLNTIKTIASVKGSVLAVKANETIFLNRAESIKLAQDNNIAIIGI